MLQSGAKLSDGSASSQSASGAKRRRLSPERTDTSPTTPTTARGYPPSEMSATGSSKTSLDYILSPSPSRDRPGSSTASAPSPAHRLSTSPGYGGKRAPAPPSQAAAVSLADMPRNILSNIAFHLVVDDDGVGRHPCALLPLVLANRAIHSAVSFDDNPALYNRLFRATFDHAALMRRFKWMRAHLAASAAKGGHGRPAGPPSGGPPGGPPGGAGGGKSGGPPKAFDLFSDPRSWAMDYKNRWETSHRMRKAVKLGRLAGVCEGEQLSDDLWTIWFLLTENDGKNVPFLAEQCRFHEWIRVYYRDDLLKDAMVPGYPKATGDKALGIWCALLSGTDAAAEQTAAEVDEKIFMLRPYVFACAKYEVTYAPWHHRRLPLGPDAIKDQDNDGDVALQSKAIPYKRFGYTWRRAPPHFILGAYLVFLRLLERHSHRVGLEPQSSTFSMPAALRHLPGLFSTTRILPSVSHDSEWQRNTVCQDPCASPGLPPSTYMGELRGFWRGKFLFYNFESYRQILSGDMRALYTGSFAEQAAELELHETVVRIRADVVGGKGPLLAAGFDDDDDNQAVSDLEQQRIRAGYGHEVVEVQGKTSAEIDADDPGWTKEILLSGRLRTSWGWACVRGRVRSWDGLVILAIAYSPHVMGKWLWRGYLHTGGYFIGRWRDSFTPEHLRGNEGAIGMVRAGALFYPPHFPQRMEDSLGVRIPTPTGPSSVSSGTATQNGQAAHASNGAAQNSHSNGST